jgi:4a-hydroxytetrahydrobiopterin dehydratase
MLSPDLQVHAKNFAIIPQGTTFNQGGLAMQVQSEQQLTSTQCVACEGGVEKYSRDEAQQQTAALAGWKLCDDGRRIAKDLVFKNFLAAIDCINQVASVAEQEGHHPDLHLEDYRRLRIELSTHSIGGLSANDFILAAKIDQLPLTRC